MTTVPRGRHDPVPGCAYHQAQKCNRLTAKEGVDRQAQGGRCSCRRRTPEVAGLIGAGAPRGDRRATRGPHEGERVLRTGVWPGRRVRGGDRPGLRPRSGSGERRLGRPPAPRAPPGTYHLGDLEAAERATQVVEVAAQAGQPAALAHRLGGRLVRAAGARDHGGARGLTLEAVQLLAAPHAAAWPGPPRAAGAGSWRSQRGHRIPAAASRLTARRPPRRRLLSARRPAAAAAQSAGARLPSPRQRKGREAGTGGEGRSWGPARRAGSGRSKRPPAGRSEALRCSGDAGWLPARPGLGGGAGRGGAGRGAVSSGPAPHLSARWGPAPRLRARRSCFERGHREEQGLRRG